MDPRKPSRRTVVGERQRLFGNWFKHESRSTWGTAAIQDGPRRLDSRRGTGRFKRPANQGGL